MKQFFKSGPCLLLVGLLLGGAAVWNLRQAAPPVQIKATATEGRDSFAIATGMIDMSDQLEGLYFLDYVTGNLKCTVLNTKTGKFNALFSSNIANDFGADPKNAKYLIVTGMARVPRGRGGGQIADSIIYVLEASTGQVAAYAVPFNTSMQAKGVPQQGEFVRLDKVRLRSTQIRD